MSAPPQLQSHSTASGSSAPSTTILSSSPSTVIIGAGSCGLAVALQLLQRGHRDIHILTRTTTPHTTSDQAGALWRPFGEVSSDNQRTFAAWGSETFTFLNQLRLKYGAETTGIVLVSGYEIFSTLQQKPFWTQDVLNFRILNREELKAIGLEGECGYSYTSIIVDMNIYLKWMHYEITRLGGRVHLIEVKCLSEVQEKYFPRARCIINCAGLGAGALVADKEIYPVAGHIVKVKAPSVHHFYMDSESMTYIFPRIHDVVVGGTYYKHDANTTPNIQTRYEILSRAEKMTRDINPVTTEVVGEYVGLRPYRDVTRLEIEYPANHNKQQKLLSSQKINEKVTIPVIHNYGHGGSGITLHWGCASQVIDLATPFLDSAASSPASQIKSKL